MSRRFLTVSTRFKRILDVTYLEVGHREVRRRNHNVIGSVSSTIQNISSIIESAQRLS